MEKSFVKTIVFVVAKRSLLEIDICCEGEAQNCFKATTVTACVDGRYVHHKRFDLRGNCRVCLYVLERDRGAAAAANAVAAVGVVVV
jgi:hypothetical protein